MGSERDIKRRIKSVRNIQQITKAMKMVAAARIKKAEDRLKAARPYTTKLMQVVRDLTSQMDEVLHPLMEVRPVERTAVLLITSDKGLCGAYNNNLLKMAWSFISKQNPKTMDLIVVGGKGEKFLKRRKVDPQLAKTGWSPDFALAQELATTLNDWFVQGRVDRVLCFYTQSISAVNQKPSEEQILPLSTDEKADPAAALSYEFEPSANQALNVLMPRYLQNLLYRVLLESKVSELGARLKAMTNATDNADKLAGSLTLEYYRIRQDNITREILEISGGAEALKASR